MKLKKGKAPATKSELVKKFDELLTTLNDPKKKKQVAATIAKVDALFVPVSKDVKVFKERCKKIEPMLKECEPLRHKQLN